MKNKLFLILFILLFAVPGFAQKVQKSDPVLTVTPGESILGRSLPPGTYRVVPELGTNQREVSVSVTLVDVDSDEQKVTDQSKINKKITQTGPQKQQSVDIERPDGPDGPGGANNPPAKPQKKPQVTQQDEPPSGTGPEFDCEYGLPKRDGANSKIQLTPGDLPSGLRLDDFANFNKACVVNQWIMQGPDRKNRIEVSISGWGPRASKYYDWKHGMLGTGEFNHKDIPVGTQQLYVEQKVGCNKQLIMQVGNYLVEMHRPIVDGLTQRTDPISKEKFVALAEACENRIEAVAGIPDKQMLKDNPNEFRWGTAVWPISFENGTLKIRGAGKPKWGTNWVVVDTKTQSYRGKGTGAGPVLTYTADNKRWTIVTLNHNTGGKANIRSFDTRISIMKAGEHGATLRIGGICYDYSWNHLEEINCKTGTFIHGGRLQKNAGIVEPVTNSTPSSGKGPGPKTPPVTNNPPTIKVPPGSDYPDWVQNLFLDILAGTPPESSGKYYDLLGRRGPQRRSDGWIFNYGEIIPFKLVDRNSGQQFSAVFDTAKFNDKKVKLGKFSGHDLHATIPGRGQIIVRSMTLSYVPKGGTKKKTKVLTKEFLNVVPSFVHVNPPLRVKAAGWPPDTTGTTICVDVFLKDSVIPVEGVRVVIQGENTPEFELGTSGYFGNVGCVTYKELRAKNIPRDIYTVYAYKRDKDLSKDLWPDREYKIAIPPVLGEGWKLRIFMTEGGKKKWILDEPGKRLN